MRRATVTTMAALAVAGCGSSAPAKRPPRATPTASATATPDAPPGRTIRFRASDGHRLTGTFSPGSGRAPAIVLSHQFRGGPDQFAELVPLLHDAGYATLAYRSRSAGELDETKLSRDVVGAVRALRRRSDVDPDRIALLGASIGGAAATWTIATHPELRLRAAVGLSAVEGPAMIEAGTAGRFHPHDLLLISDRREHLDAVNIRNDAGGKGVRSYVAPVPGHGVALIPDASVRDRILAWLRPRLRR